MEIYILLKKLGLKCLEHGQLGILVTLMVEYGCKSNSEQ